MIAPVAALLAVSVAIGLLGPIWRSPRGSLDRTDSAMAILRDQLGEVVRDRARGLISDADARAAEVEIKRRILATDRDRRDGGATGQGRALLVAAALAVPVAAATLYRVTGAPDVPSLPFADRGAEQADTAEIEALTRQLFDRLANDPEGGPTEGWLLLAETWSRAGRFADAADAYARLIDRPDAASGTLSRYAEALIQAEGGIVTPPAEAAIDRALALDADNPAGSFYKSLALEQGGDPAAARGVLLDRLDRAAGSRPSMESFVARANAVGRQIGAPPVALADYAPVPVGPDGNDIAAAGAMSPRERDAFIRSMVDRLAARLEEAPGDLDGWIRLAAAYEVLGETDQARDAWRKAEDRLGHLPDADPRRAAIADALAGATD